MQWTRGVKDSTRIYK